MKNILSSDATELANPLSIENLAHGGLVSFLLVQADNSPIPVISMDAWQNYSLSFEGVGRRAAVAVRHGNAGAVSDWSFRDLDVILDNGDYYFDKLITRGVDWFVKEGAEKVVIHQEHLETDFESFADIRPPLYYDAPTESLRVIVNRSINHIRFLDDHEVVVEHDGAHVVFDLSQIPSDNAPPAFVMSAKNLTFDFNMGDMSDPLFFPRMSFNLHLGTTITMNIPQLDDDAMDLSDRITFVHGNSILNIFSTDPNVTIPTFGYEGAGKHYENTKTVTFYKSYCLCQGLSKGEICTNLCGQLPIVDYDHVADTAIGNPNDEIRYTVIGSSEGDYPILDLAHYDDTNLTVIGGTKGQFVKLIGKAQGDADTIHKFAGLTIAVGGDVEFSHVEFSNCDWFKEGERSEIVSDELTIDIGSYKSMPPNIEIVPPPYGITIETSNALREVVVEIEGPNSIRLNDKLVSSCPETRSKITITTSCNVKIGLSDAVLRDPEVSKLPKLWFKLEADMNLVTFIGSTWPECLNDITAKVMIEHGDNSVYIRGQPKTPTSFAWKPPMVASIGSGPIYFNNVLANYADTYCICEGDDCVGLCESHGPVCAMDMKSIVATLDNNPSRSISYLIHHSNKEHRPEFDLDDFHHRSFFVSGEEERQYVKLNGFDEATTIPPTGITHAFKNVNIDFGPGAFHFNNLVVRDISIDTDASLVFSYKGITADFPSLQVLEEKELLASPSLYMKVLGRKNLETVVLASHGKVELQDFLGKSVSLNLEKLQKPVTISSDMASKDAPLRIVCEDQGLEPVNIPKVTIDLTGSKEEDVYVTFAGSKMKEVFEKIKDRVSILYGQADLHVQAEKDEHGDFKWKPSNVDIHGMGDYYVNDRRQANLLAHSDNTDKDDEEGISSFAIAIGCVCITVCLLIVAYMLSKRNRGISPYGRPDEVGIDGMEVVNLESEKET